MQAFMRNSDVDNLITREPNSNYLTSFKVHNSFDKNVMTSWNLYTSRKTVHCFPTVFPLAVYAIR